MSELISGKEAWNAKSDGKNVLWSVAGLDYGLSWQELTDKEFMNWDTGRFLLPQTNYRFKLKPRTINLNGTEVPTPFDPIIGENVWILSDAFPQGYACIQYEPYHKFIIGAWRTEEEIKQVVTALRSVFNE